MVGAIVGRLVGLNVGKVDVGIYVGKVGSEEGSLVVATEVGETLGWVSMKS